MGMPIPLSDACPLRGRSANCSPGAGRAAALPASVRLAPKHMVPKRTGVFLCYRPFERGS